MGACEGASTEERGGSCYVTCDKSEKCKGVVVVWRVKSSFGGAGGGLLLGFYGPDRDVLPLRLA